MPTSRYSQNRFDEAIIDENGLLYLVEAVEPYGFQDFDDNRTHIAIQGDTWHSLAARYFPEYPRPDALWWVIFDFQPQPAVDPTVGISPNAVVYIPSARTLEEEILAEARRDAPPPM